MYPEILIFSNRLIKGRTVSFIKKEESRSARYRCEYPDKERKKKKRPDIRPFVQIKFLENITAGLNLLQYKVFVTE